MKKILLACLLLPFIFSSVNAEEIIGKVNSVETWAYGTRIEQKRNPLFSHDKVYEQEVIETVTDSEISITFVDGTEFYMGGNAAITLDELIYSTERESMIVTLAKGVFRFISGSISKETVIINSPVATIGIRGTDLEIHVDSTGAITATAFEGSIIVTTLDGRYVETNGCQTVEVLSNGAMNVGQCRGGPSVGVADASAGPGGGNGSSSGPGASPSGGSSGGSSGGGSSGGDPGDSSGPGNGNGNSGNSGSGGGNTGGSGPGTGNNGGNNGQGNGAGNGGGGSGNGGAR